MKSTITIIGIVLIVLGVIGLIYGGITYISSRDVVDMGIVQFEVNQQEHIPLSPIFGGIALACGIVLMIVGQKERFRK